MPLQIPLSQLDDGSGIAETFIARKARWHKSCSAKFNSTKLQRVEKRRSSEQEGLSSEKFTGSTQISSATPAAVKKRFFCEEDETKINPLRSASTFSLDSRVRDCAAILQDEALLAKLSAGDLVAIEAKYHSNCLASLYNKAQSATTEFPRSGLNALEGIALAELVSYIEESRLKSATLSSTSRV